MRTWFRGGSPLGPPSHSSDWLAGLEAVTNCDIAIRPFRVDFDDVVFGLIDETTDDPYEGHGGPWAELLPQGLGFHEPWNGQYDT
ncbi:hypothetical protein ACWT_3792 [Actinoplanes sp. SE50]|nr:hypothetical protein ACPL_3920 [Actinoplanes sp. SE50/110]ATO83207.1 hypothetical protein ACWT_3792 [Actinoplanes sp. SE50]SLM00614.1 hypothetical protein ACSP50_3847 [Actinoplanes sp. SE50/110]